MLDVLGGNMEELRTSSRPKHDDESDSEKGKYEPVGPRPHPPKNGRLFSIAFVVILLLCGMGFMLIHHFFYTYLNEKSIDPSIGELPHRLQNQEDVDFIGKTIAHGARIMLSMAIGATFAQLFWETLRSRSHSIAQIDALVNCGQSPFQPSSVRSVTISVALLAVSLVASITSLLVVLTPGSLTISSNLERSRPCTVPSIPQDVTKSDFNYTSRAKTALTGFPPEAVLSTILSSNTYLPPFEEDQARLCNNSTSCSYNITFFGSALNCSDVTDQTDLSSLVDPKLALSNSTPFVVWDASGTLDQVGISILSRDLVNGVSQATNCSAFNASYDISVNLDTGSFATVQVWSAALGSPIAFDDSFVSFYTQNGIGMLLGTVLAGPNGTLSRNELGYIPSPFFVTTSTGNHTFSGSIADFASSFMQNLSLSLLSGSFNYGISNDTASNFEDVSSICAFPVTVYVYNSARLLGTYGAILGVAVLVAAYGCWLIWRCGKEQKFVFSDVVHASLNEEMFSAAESLQRSTQLELLETSRSPGKFLPVSPNSDGRTDLDTKAIPTTIWNSLAAVRGKMTLLIIAALSCMILNHAYFDHLDGKKPSASIRGSGFFSNQIIVSDIGTGLSYTGQTFLAATIAASCTQLFWRGVRSRGHTIRQIDALMKVQVSPISPSLLHALRASRIVPLLALLAASTSLVSIFAPGSITVDPNHVQTQDCTVLSLRNLSTLETNLTDYTSSIFTGMSLATYLPPADPCSSGPDSLCGYDLDIVGPGFDCEDVTASSNKTGFATRFGQGITPLYFAQVEPQTNNLTMQTSVQTMDVDGSGYQAVNCTAVLRSYSISVAHGPPASSTINVTDSQILSVVHANSSALSTFAEAYLSSMLVALQQAPVLSAEGTIGMGNSALGALSDVVVMPFSVRGGIGKVQLDGNITWAANMAQALEDFAQNATLSLLSGQVFAFNPEDSKVLENVTTQCGYGFPAYKYVPYRLFVTYGVATFVTVLCTILGSVAIWRNGADERMDFSRFLGSVMNERLYSARERLDGDIRLKANETVDGGFVPSLS